MASDRGAVTIPGWIQWGAGVILTTMGLGAFGVSWAYTTFQTAPQAERSERTIMDRLDRIEGKLDSVLERRR